MGIRWEYDGNIVLDTPKLSETLLSIQIPIGCAGFPTILVGDQS